MGLTTLDQILQHANPSLSASFADAQDPFDEPATSLAVGAAAALPPQDGMSQRPLGGVVRRLDALSPHERPQLPLMDDQLPARRRRFGTPAGLPILQRLK